MSAKKTVIALTAILALAATAAVPAIGATATPAAGAKILDLKLTPTKIKTNKSLLVIWELNRAARTSFQVARCQNSSCTNRTKIGSPIRRLGGADLNFFRLKARLSPGRYAIVATAGQSTKKALFRVVR